MFNRVELQNTPLAPENCLVVWWKTHVGVGIGIVSPLSLGFRVPFEPRGPAPQPQPPSSFSLSGNQAPDGRTHTARRGSGCGSGSHACSLLGRCSSLNPQASPGSAPEPGGRGSRGETKRGSCPPGPSSGWQGTGSRKHRPAAGTGLSGLPDMGCFPGAPGLQRQKPGERERARERS